MSELHLPSRLRTLLILLGIREACWLAYDLSRVLGHKTSDLGLVVFETTVHLGLCYLIARALYANPASALALAWLLRILGVLYVIGSIGITTSADYRVQTWQLVELWVSACLSVVVGFWLARVHKQWRAKLQIPVSTIPELEVQEPYVRYPRN